MPTYEYECTACGIRFERRQRISEDPIQICPECAGQVRRVFHPVLVVFKGSGFYATDNRRTSRSSSSHRGKPSDDTSSNGTGKSTESSSPESEGEKSHSKA